jgi:hypothetical protein
MNTEDNTSDPALTFALLFRGGAIATDRPGVSDGFRPLELPTGERVTALGETFLAECRQHLTNADAPIGVYPLCPDTHHVYWGCVDFDEGDEESLIHAKNLELALDRMGAKGWIERSRSKGYHVWVFFTGGLPAADVRNGLLAMCQVVNAPIKEINPKQTELTGRGWGNGVRLPYPAGRQPDRNVILSGGAEIPMETFVKLAHQSRCTPATWRPVSALYSPPEALPATDWGVTSTAGDLTGLAAVIRSNGPRPESGKPEGDRSSTLFSLACAMLKDGHSAARTLEELRSADVGWGGKYAARPDGEKWLRTTVENAQKRVGK